MTSEDKYNKIDKAHENLTREAVSQAIIKKEQNIIKKYRQSLVRLNLMLPKKGSIFQKQTVGCVTTK